jgi:D-alanyl-D-alanine carboxypeptidase/D-alanyl-D-alanine-endopeptidase (penicillin-binding protein 4)
MPVLALITLVTVLAVLAAVAGYVTTGRVRGSSSASKAGATSLGPSSGAQRPSGPSSGPSASSPPVVVAAATRTPTVPTAPAAGVLPVAAKLAAATRTALANPALGRSVPGLVVDVATGAVLLNHSATTKVPPASTTKITTATAVLAVISPQKRIDTRVVEGSKAGQIVLVGGGDPTLSAAATGHATLYPNAARLSVLATAARKALGRPVTSIVVDASLFTGPTLGPGWAASDVPTSYGAAIQALMVDGGRPATGGETRSARPALEAGRALARLLGRPTLPVTAGQAAAGARVLGTVHSAPMLDLVERAMLDSDNVIAEMLGRQVARAEHKPLSFAGTVVAVRAALASVGFRLPATLVDASGLSSRDRLTPATLVALLRLDAGSAHPRLNQVVSALPVAGWEGTLAQRYRVSGVTAAGRVRAKTGTLTGVVALAGLVRDRSGRLLVFAFVADRVPNGTTLAAEAALDRVAASFAACGCR